MFRKISKNFEKGQRLIITSSVRLDQEIYFIHTNDWTWHEKYSINNVEISRQLGRFQKRINSTDPMILVQEPDLKPFVARRSNFQGKALMAVTTDSRPYIRLDIK
jgi:hypothetical protein